MSDGQSLLSELLVGTTVLSMKVAGPELEVFFTGCKGSATGLVSIDTDAWIAVNPERSIDLEKIDTEFFPSRRLAIVGIYDLTGFDVEAVRLSAGGILELVVGGQVVAICPSSAGSSPDQDSWAVVVDGEHGRLGRVSFHVGHGLIIRGEEGQLRP